MKTSILSFYGYMTSADVQVLSIAKGYPLCRFSLMAQGQKVNCLLSGQLAYQALYELREKDRIYVEGRFNDRQQFIILNYRLVSSTYPSNKSFA